MNARMRLVASGMCAALLALPTTGHAAEAVHLTLKLDGIVIPGDSTVASLGRDGTIECVLFRTGLRTANATSPILGGTISIRKRIDRSTPFLLRALTARSVADATFRFYRPSPAGDGTTEQFYTVVGTGGLVTSVRQLVSDTLDPASSTSPPLEEVTFQFSSMAFTTVEGVTAKWEGKI